MNSRSSVNETNLVNFPPELPSLSQLDAKEGLLSFPFDHIYACNSDSSDRRDLQLDKEVEISTHVVIPEEKSVSTPLEISRLSDRLTASESQNKRLKDLLVYHLDLIQQQNELISKRDKLYQTLQQENDSLRSRLNRVERPTQRHVNPAQPLVHVPATPVTSTVVRSDQIMLNSFTELLLPADTQSSSYLFDSDLNKNATFDLGRSSDPDVSSYLQNELTVSSILDQGLACEANYTMIDNKRPYIKKEVKVEPKHEPVYLASSAVSKVSRNRKKTPSSGSARTSKAKVELPGLNRMFDNRERNCDRYTVTKKNRLNTYSKRTTTVTSTTTTVTTGVATIPPTYTGSLSDRLRLIDTTPTGEDPYQMGEADMRDQSPIPKLMLQKTNHGRMRVCSETTPRRIYDPTVTADIKSSKLKMDRYMASPFVPEVKQEDKTVIVEEPDLDLVKTETEIDWRLYSKVENDGPLCEFSFGDGTNNSMDAVMLPSLDACEFQELFTNDPTLSMDTLNNLDFPMDKTDDKIKKRSGRSISLVGQLEEDSSESKRGADSKRGRKRAYSTTGLKNSKTLPMPTSTDLKQIAKPKLVKGKAACRGKKSPLPGMTTSESYHTLVGEPDLSWYLGLDPDLKYEDLQMPGESKAATVEVPRWREKPYTSCYTLEGTENVDDRVFEKRHQKLEAEERRQLRWHMRRIREQRHVEKLRQRQRDSWCGSPVPPPVYSVLPRPQRDCRFIEITETLPVTAFGEHIPDVPESDFMLPWVRTSKALKRSKRSKTLH